MWTCYITKLCKYPTTPWAILLFRSANESRYCIWLYLLGFFLKTEKHYNKNIYSFFCYWLLFYLPICFFTISNDYRIWFDYSSTSFKGLVWYFDFNFKPLKILFIKMNELKHFSPVMWDVNSVNWNMLLFGECYSSNHFHFISLWWIAYHRDKKQLKADYNSLFITLSYVSVSLWRHV